ncbi:MAG: tRNA epoxyqueuosine(34) reductase QueG [Cellvibrionaceae bacterium]
MPSTAAWQTLAGLIKQWGRELGFQQVGITDIDLGQHKDYLEEWLNNGYQGEMEWIRAHQPQRNNPDMLVTAAARVISARMDYLPENTEQIKILKQSEKAYISRYALGRDYHKLIRKRLAQLGKKIEQYVKDNDCDMPISQRPFVDSAPVLEKAFAEKAGLGWIGKHTVLLNESAGSWFFLGELITNIPLPTDTLQTDNRCGSCEACLKICPTDAFIAPYQLDATRCISYLTIELKGSIPEEFREPMGNRVFGCDDCQLICPWNKFAKPSEEKDFSPRHQLDDAKLIDLFLWTEEQYLKNTEGSAIRRIGYERWLRNLAIGLGNAAPSEEIITALTNRKDHPSSIVKEHVEWALQQQLNPKKRKRKIRRRQSD